MISQTIDTTTVVVMVILFTAALILSGFITYKLRMNKIKSDMQENKDNNDKDS